MLSAFFAYTSFDRDRDRDWDWDLERDWDLDQDRDNLTGKKIVFYVCTYILKLVKNSYYTVVICNALTLKFRMRSSVME